MAAQTVNWHSEAQEDYRQIIDYLLEEWDFEVADKFTNQVDEVVRPIEAHPNIGMRVGRLRSIRKSQSRRIILCTTCSFKTKSLS